MLPLPWWLVVLGYLAMSAGASLTFVFLLIGTHFSDETDFPTAGAGGELGRTWAEHQLATACDWSPESRWAHLLAGGVNAHAAWTCPQQYRCGPSPESQSRTSAAFFIRLWASSRS